MTVLFQIYQNPRAATYREEPDSASQIVSVLGIVIDDQYLVPGIRYLITGGAKIEDGANPRLVMGDTCDIFVAPGR